MRLGNLRDKVTLQQLIETPDDNVGTIRKFKDIKRIWASIDPAKGNSYYLNQQIDADITHIVRIRYIDDITAENYFIYWNFKRYRVRQVKNIYEFDRWLELYCEEEEELPAPNHALLTLFCC